MEWQEIAGNWILVPRNPIGIIHFLGGAFAAAAPQITYRWLLEQLAKQGYIIVATPFDNVFNRNAFDHGAIARSALIRFENALDYLVQRRLAHTDLPIYGMGHSVGCKLHILISSLFDSDSCSESDSRGEGPRVGNILMAFNNYPAKRAIPLFEQVSQASSFLDETIKGTQTFLQTQLESRSEIKDQTRKISSFFNRVAEQVAQAVPKDVSDSFAQQLSQLTPDLESEFRPSPTETQRIVGESYGVPCNLLIQFQFDDIDQTDSLFQTLNRRFPSQITLQQLPGNHLTPLGQDVQWAQGRDFSPLDAVGQFVRQGTYHDLSQLKRTILQWINSSRGA